MLHLIRMVCIAAAMMLFTGCANDAFVRYRPSSNSPLNIHVSPSVKTPDEIPIAGLTAAWGATLGAVAPTAGTQMGREGTALAKQSINRVPAPKSEMASALLAEVTSALRSNSRFQITKSTPAAEFHFEVYFAVFSVDSGFSADMKPLVGVKGNLVGRDGAVLWKYITTFQQTRDVEASDDDVIRRDPTVRAELLKSAVRKASADMMADLSR